MDNISKYKVSVISFFLKSYAPFSGGGILFSALLYFLKKYIGQFTKTVYFPSSIRICWDTSLNE